MGLLSVILNKGFSWIDILSCLISCSIVVFLILPVHEYAHGFVASKLGDPTARYQGRLKLNPMAHIDYMGALMIYLVGFGWAKPVPVNSRYFNNPKRDMAITALAGPLSNIICAFIAVFLSNLFVFIYYYAMNIAFFSVVLYILANIFTYVALINLSLAFFNLIPIPPLDGSKILAAFLPDRIYYKLMQYERYFMIFIMILVFAGSGISNILSRVSYGVFNVFGKITWLPFEFILGL